MSHKKIWTLNKNGEEVLRDLEEECKNFDYSRLHSGEIDSSVGMWHELFESYIYDDNGCDYERYGCKINEGDVVLDIGANIGIFAYRAEFRGASKVISFEPLKPTYNCLMKNKGEKTEIYNLAVGGKNEFRKFLIHTDFSHNGGGSYNPDNIVAGRNVIYNQFSYVIDINEIFNSLCSNVDFMKMDIEGGEVECLTSISDENLKKLRCFAAEFHCGSESFQIFQDNFLNRMDNLGFYHFVLYHGNGNLRTINCWKK